MLDYHVHTEYSIDCKIPMAVQCEAAVAAGVTEIAFCDHLDHEPSDPGYGYYRPEAFFASIAECRERFGDRLVVLAGVEADFNERIADDVARFLSHHEFDFVIGSVHYGEAGQIIFQDYFDDREWDDVYLPYLRRLKLAASSGLFDTLGHIDLPKRYAPQAKRTYDPVRYKDGLQELFEILIRERMSFEINTSGLRQSPKTSMPGPAIVRWYVEAGGTLITTGTDSHAPQHIGSGIPQTLDMLELCGIDSVSSFRNRERTQRSIASLRPSATVTTGA
ncbi:MAG: histidinol-phosphatase HisJ family protein [Thermomicrobiales bacterium]|nr:histidinol-phosphatase HisJ family protein [Thermomicrobiales bacterium]